jgi:uncharacterized membrane protein (DUF485 family)
MKTESRLREEVKMELKKEAAEPPVSLNYKRMVVSSPFQKLIKSKKRFTLFTTVFFLAFSLLLPVLAFYSDVLTKPLIEPFSWGWAFAFAQFFMTWGVCHLYIKKAAQFDQLAKDVLEAEEKEMGRDGQ